MTTATFPPVTHNVVKTVRVGDQLEMTSQQWFEELDVDGIIRDPDSWRKAGVSLETPVTFERFYTLWLGPSSRFLTRNIVAEKRDDDWFIVTYDGY